MHRPVQRGRLPETEGVITIDGKSKTESGWRPRSSGWCSSCRLPAPTPSEPSEVLLAHDGEALYAAARFADSEPALIRANRLKRDETSGDDLFGLVVDSFNDDNSALAFYTNPAGPGSMRRSPTMASGVGRLRSTATGTPSGKCAARRTDGRLGGGDSDPVLIAALQARWRAGGDGSAGLAIDRAQVGSRRSIHRSTDSCTTATAGRPWPRTWSWWAWPGDGSCW